MPSFSVSVYERPGSPFWWAKCYLSGEGGRPHRWSTGVRVAEGGKRESRRAATRRAEEHAERLAASATPPPAGGQASLIEVAARLLRQKAADGRRERAVSSLAHVLDKHALPFFGPGRDVRTIRRSDLEAFKGHLVDAGKAPVTINNCLVAIRQVLKHAANVDELLEVVPHVANVRVSSESKGRALRHDEVMALLDAIDPRAVEARQYLSFVANTGLRKAECLAMRWGWIDWDRAELKVPAEFRKGAARRAAPVPLNPMALSILRERQEHGTKYTGSAKRPLPTGPEDRVWLQVKHDVARNSASERAGLGKVRTHDLRHTFGSNAWATGASLPEVRDLLGHRTLAMVSRYAHSYGERLHAAAARAQIGVCPVSVPTDGSNRAQKGPDRAQRRKRAPRKGSK